MVIPFSLNILRINNKLPSCTRNSKTINLNYSTNYNSENEKKGKELTFFFLGNLLKPTYKNVQGKRI